MITKQMVRRIFQDNKLFQELAAAFIKTAKSALSKKERITVALAGGRTPRAFYEVLASDQFKDQLDWSRLDFFFGDERDVSPMSERSNYRMTDEFLFKPLAIENTQVFRWQTEIIEVSEVAVNYEKIVRRYFGLSETEFPVFDFVFLGLGNDGHTASLFPFTDALTEDSRIAVANRVEKFDSFRLTLTYPVFNNARIIYFVVTGDSKAAAVGEVLSGNQNCSKFPAQCIEPTRGKLNWFIGESAASGLKGKAAA